LFGKLRRKIVLDVIDRMTFAGPISDGAGHKTTRPLAHAARPKIAILDRFA
jgi:hypothetical protein